MNMNQLMPSVDQEQTGSNFSTNIISFSGASATTPFQELSVSQAMCNSSLSEESSQEMEAMREMIFRIAAMEPIHIDLESIKPPKRRNVKLSRNPRSVAARHRRERIGERIRILQKLVPGGTEMDTVSILDETIHYMKFLKRQVQFLKRAAATNNVGTWFWFPAAMSTESYYPLEKTYQPPRV